MPRIIIARPSGAERLEVDQATFDEGFYPGFVYVADASGSPSSEPSVLDGAVASLVPSASASATSTALRAALGLPVAATVTTAGTLVVQKHNPVDATSAAKTMTLPTGASAGNMLAVEKTDATTNIVTVSGNMRGASGQTIQLLTAHEVRVFVADSAGSWWPIADHRTKASLDAAYGRVVTAQSFGVVGNGVADDSAALNAAATFAATYGLRLLLGEGSTIKLASVAFAPPSGSRIDGNHATIVNALPGDGTTASTGVAINLESVSDVAIWNLKIDGNKAAFAGVTEYRHNIRIVGAIATLLRDVTSINAKGDGVYVGNETIGASSNVQMWNVTCDGNHRNGMSVSACTDLYAFGCRFLNSSGTAPQAGLDIEPNTTGAAVAELKFVSCTFSGNLGDGMGVSCRDAATATQAGFEFVGCTFANNGTNGIELLGCLDLRLLGGTVTGNGTNGIQVTVSSVGTITRHLRASGLDVHHNAQAGINVVGTLEHSSIIGCTVRDNSQTTANTYDGLNLVPSGAYTSTGVRLIGNTFSGSSQRYGVRTSTAVTTLTLVGNEYANNGTGDRSLSGTSRTDLDFNTSPWAVTFPMRITADSGLVTYEARVTADTQDRWVLRSDGKNQWGPGNATFDTDLSRVAANVLGLGANDAFMTGKSVTGSRPTAASVGQGGQFFDTTLNKPIWSDGTNWRDAAGTIV